MSLICRPEGCWKAENEPDELLKINGDVSQQGEVYLYLLGRGWGKSLGDDWEWLQSFLGNCLSRIAEVDELLPWTQCQTYASVAYWERKKELPYFEGSEEVTEEMLIATWKVAYQSLREGIQNKGGNVRAFLSSLGSHWGLVGRIILHLAELPVGGERPFGFMATLAERVTQEGKLTHIPLARVLKMRRQSGESIVGLLKPLQEACHKSSWLRDAVASKMIFKAVSMTPDEAYAFIKDIPLLRECGLVTRMPAGWQDGIKKVKLQVSIGESEHSQTGRPLWSFDASVALDGQDLSDEEWERIRSADSGLVLLRGQWVEVDVPRVQKLLREWGQLKFLYGQGFPLTIAMKLLSGVSGNLVPIESGESSASIENDNLWTVIQAKADLADHLRSLINVESLPIDKYLRADLRPYQKEGVSWLLSLYKLGVGACLADDMGLGKTVQVLAFLSALRVIKNTDQIPPKVVGMDGRKPCLIVAPNSLLDTWRQEAQKFTPHLRVGIFHGAHSDVIDSSLDVVITTYSLCSRRDVLSQHLWKVVVLDEAQNIKNAQSLQSKGVFSLKADMKVALTGTPIENGLSDLWGLFRVINPDLLPSTYGEFKASLECLGKTNRYVHLRSLVQPFILRRMKTSPVVALQLPPKVELNQFCHFSHRQAVLYAYLTEELRKELFNKEEIINHEEEGELKNDKRALILKYMLRFKQLCDHPSLLNGDNQFKPEDGGKFERLEELAKGWIKRQEKVLIFTQFREMCIPIARFLTTLWGRPGLVMHGGTPLSQRRQDVIDFQRQDGPPFYVLSVKTAGTGLTLTQATQVVHFDRWWNPAVENQASDRAYRIGQNKSVFVHKFMVRGTLEDKIDQMIKNKKSLADDILDFESSALDCLMSMTNEEIMDFVKQS